MKRTIEHIRDEYLVLRVQGGDPTGFEELIGRWQRRIRGFVLRHLDGHGDAVDIEQDIWLAVAKSIRQLEDPASFPQWIYRIAHGKCVNWIRRRQRDRLTLNEAERRGATRSETTAPSGVADDVNMTVRWAIERLSDDERTVLTMFYIDDLSTRDIAHVLGIPQGTVKSRLYHARRHLRAVVERSLS